eukprot:m.14569 g.14569  ORF g.14569 m.14569 type:complete len:346 (+) comp4844_c1_seq1:335-1372(+)
MAFALAARQLVAAGCRRGAFAAPVARACLSTVSRRAPTATTTTATTTTTAGSAAATPFALLRRAFARRAGETVAGETVAVPAGSGQGVSATQLGVAVLAAGGVVGLGLFGASAFSHQFVHDGMEWPDYVRERVGATFRAFGTGVVFTAVAATAFFRSGVAFRVAQFGLPGILGSFAVTLVSMAAVHMVPYENTLAKYGTLALFNSMIGLSISPMLVLGGPLILKAAVYTAGIVGSLAFVAANSPSEKFLWMAGPLSMGLGAVLVSSLGAAIFPAARVAPLLMNVSLYGGLALFSAFILYDTSVIVRRAQSEPAFDPVSASIGIYMDAVNIFVRVATMLAGSNNRR